MIPVHMVLAALLSTTVLATGCSRPGSPGSTRATIEPAPDAWLGKWNGPEGTFLQVAGGNGKYELTVQNLDGPRKFAGTAVGSSIEFERDGVREAIRATAGVQTGMKWLAGKSNCLTVRLGEGYCKD